MQKWLENKPAQSVVYISMGSTGHLTQELADSLIGGVSMANYSVLWALIKSNQVILQSLDIDREKVFIASWIPQLSALKHKSIHSAILHGGLGGFQEAFSFAVPVLVLPPSKSTANDQWDNAIRVQHYKYGEIIERKELTASIVAEKLRIIDTELYRSSVRKLQRLYKQAGGVYRAAELVELYAEIGYDHLIPAYAKYEWSWVQYSNVDVYLLLIAVVGFLCWV